MVASGAQGHGGSAKVGNDKVHPSTTFWVIFWYIAAALYAYMVFLVASWMVLIITVGPFVFYQLLPYYLHGRLYPYRNQIVQGHMLGVSVQR